MTDGPIGKRLLRAVAFGLLGGLAVAAVVLAALAVLRLQVDCAALSAEECAFERSLASSIARLQAFAAAGCAAVAGGGLVLLRRRT
ncbi:MAG: hypothetical protein IAE78_26745 [Myxococcus sp.]|nr:hypothetical protein [Myxococcus sp.]